MTTPTAIGHNDTSQHLLLSTTSSQPSNYAPTTPKYNPITPKTTQAAIKLPANDTKPEMAMMTTSDATIDMNMIM